ncbi:MAG: methyltransferase domain-containing protein, partial [Akkermansiaceae bacterium]|nr:methyltransferase domain-containing protein [Akkermansiaceae bacterium]
PFASGALAGATLIEVIEHIIQAESLAAELHRVIRPGGWLVLTTPNVVHWTYRFRALTGHPP